MEDYEFYREYANLPLSKRVEFFGYAYNDIGGENLTPNMLYKEIHAIDNKIRQDLIRKEKLLRIADRYFNKES